MQTLIPLEDIELILKDFEENRLNPGCPEFPELETKAERFKMLRRVYWAIAIAQGKTLAAVNQERGELLPEAYVKTADPIDATIPDHSLMEGAIAPSMTNSNDPVTECTNRLDEYLEYEATGIVVTEDITKVCLLIIQIVAEEFPDGITPEHLQTIETRLEQEEEDLEV